MFIKNLKYTFVYIANTDKDCELVLDRPVLSTRKTAYDKQNCNYLDYNQNLVIIPLGAQCQDGPTDRPSIAKYLWLWN
jgi:hypothetical protein